VNQLTIASLTITAPLLILKLGGATALPWLWVLCPLWLPVVVVIGICVVSFVYHV